MHSQSGELTYRQVDQQNIQTALAMQHQTWPHEPADADYEDKLKYPDDPSNASWLVYAGKDLVGLTGVFVFDSDEPGYDGRESIWLDWFMVLPEFRRRGFGRQILHDMIKHCQDLGGFKFMRLDTIYIPGRPALALYDQVMHLCERYTLEDTPDHDQHYLIYSYSLDQSPVKPWDNRFLNLGDNLNY